MDNLSLYEQGRAVPDTALRTIEKGNLKGKSDINPVWRIKKLTEMFGPVGIGWYTEITREWTEQGAGQEVILFVKLKLFIKVDGEWSKGIEGTGGNMLINDFKNAGVRNNDEALKMAETDAISVACKKIGIGADVYWDKDKTKYTNTESDLQKENKHFKEEYEKLAENFKKLKEEYIKLSENDKGKQKKSKSELREEFETKIQNILFLASGKKLENVPALLEKHSSFTGKDGKEVAGEKDIKKLSDGRIQATYGKLQTVYPDIYTAVKEAFEERKREV